MLGRLGKRLGALEVRLGVPSKDEDALQRAISRESLSRLTDEELGIYEAALERVEAGEDLLPEEEAAVCRAKQVYEGVRREFAEAPA